MILGREQIIQLEALAKTQQRIWNDACDIGLAFSENRRKQLHDLVLELAREVGNKKVTKWSNGSAVEIRCPVEIDNGVECGMLVRVALHDIKDPHGFQNAKFFTIEISRY